MSRNSLWQLFSDRVYLPRSPVRENSDQFRGRKRRDDLGALVGHVRSADRTGQASERLRRPATLDEGALETGALRGRADHADIGRIAPLERGAREAVVERVGVGEDHVGGTGRCFRNSLGWVVKAPERDFGQGVGFGFKPVERGSGEDGE